VEALRGGGARVLDVREPAEFAGAHLSGSINIGLGGKYATWCGTLLKPEEDIVIIAEPGREIEAATRLGRIGYDRVVGYLEGGMQPLESRAELVGRIERIAPARRSRLSMSGRSRSGRRARSRAASTSRWDFSRSAPTSWVTTP